MTSQRSLDRLEAEMRREEIEADIIDIPEVVDISGNIIYIVSEDVREKVIELIQWIPDWVDFLKNITIKVSWE